MSRVALGIVTAAVAGLLTVSPAAAGCCGWGGWNAGWGVGWNAGWNGGWGTGCCSAGVAPVVVAVAPAPLVVRVAPVTYPALWVNQGPVYSGPGPNFAPDVYTQPAPVRSYPYAPGYYRSWTYGPRPVYRSWRYGVRPAYRVNRVTAYRSVRPIYAPRVTVKRWH